MQTSRRRKMIGTALNVAGIVIGGIAGLSLRRALAPSLQQLLKQALGIYTVWTGLRIAVGSLHSPAGRILRQLAIVVLAMILGRLLGRLFHLQKGLNRLGQIASRKLSDVPPGRRPAPEAGFLAAAILVCAAPLAMLGPVQDGLNGDFQPLLLKGIMDGLMVMALVPTFGWTVILAALPAAALQVTLARLVQVGEPALRGHDLIDPVNGACGLLIFCVALIIFAIRKVEVGDYLPALAIAPILGWLWQ
jgi:uncharacterized protein